MTMKTSLRLVKGIAIVDVSGSLVALPGEDGLRERLVRVFEDGHSRILVNLEKVEHSDSGGLGDLIASFASITRRGGAVKLLRPQQRLRQMLRTTHIESLFEVLDDEGAAVAGFEPLKSADRKDSATGFFRS
jgi:anti-sigma B factor antagonist